MAQGGREPVIEPTHAGVEMLRTVPMFERLDPVSLARLDAISEVMTVEAQTVLCRQSETPSALHLLLEGQIVLTRMAPDGSQALLEVPGPDVQLHPRRSTDGTAASGDCDDGHPGAASDHPRARAARAGADRARYRARIAGNGGARFPRHGASGAGPETAHGAQRLGCYLLALVVDPNAASAQLRLPFDKALLAGRLGCRPDSLSRAFAVLRDFGVETHGATVILHDVPRLRQYAMPDEIDESDRGE